MLASLLPDEDNSISRLQKMSRHPRLLTSSQSGKMPSLKERYLVAATAGSLHGLKGINNVCYKQCLKIEKMKELFPRKIKHHEMAKRNSEVFDFVKPKTTRYQLSAIPVMQRMLDKAELKQRQIFSKLNSFCTSGL